MSLRIVDSLAIPMSCFFSELILLIALTLLGPAGTARLPWIGPFMVKLLIGRRGPCSSARNLGRTRLSAVLDDTMGRLMSATPSNTMIEMADLGVN